MYTQGWAENFADQQKSRAPNRDIVLGVKLPSTFLLFYVHLKTWLKYIFSLRFLLAFLQFSIRFDNIVCQRLFNLRYFFLYWFCRLM